MGGRTNLHDGSPEVHRLEPDLALPHPLEPPLLLRALSRALPSLAARAAEARGILELRTEGSPEGRLLEQRS